MAAKTTSTVGSTLKGGAGDDVLNGGEGSDEINGGNGRDQLFGGAGADKLSGGEGDDLLDGGTGNDIIAGGDGNDSLIGGAGNDILNGDSGDDFFDSGAGNDDIDGGSGLNTARYHGSISDFRIAPVFSNGSANAADMIQRGYTVTDLRTGAPEGLDIVRRVGALQFDDGVIYLDGRNSAPVAGADSLAAVEDIAVTIPASALLANDSDANGDLLVIASVGSAANGTVSLSATGVIVYQGNANFSGTDSFTYTISDGHGGTATATVLVNVAAMNDGPVAVNDALAASEDVAQTFSAAALIGNDSDADGDALVIASVDQGTHGNVTLNADGTVTYRANANYSGADSFSYTVSDAHGGTSTATVNVTVAAVADAPILSATNVEGSAGDAIGLNLSAALADTDGSESLALVVSGLPQGASLSAGVDNGNGSWTLTSSQLAGLTITPPAGVFGVLQLTLTATAMEAGGDSKSVSTQFNVEVLSGNNHVPVAMDDSFSTAEDALLLLSPETLLANDLDGDGNPLSIFAVGGAAHGAVTLNGDGSISYAPTLNFNGADSFSYTVADGVGGFSTATVHVDVAAVNDRPSISVPTRGLVMTFEDLPAVESYDEVPTGYGGFDWVSPNDLYYINGTATGGPYGAGTVSGTNSVFPTQGPQPGKVIWQGGGTIDWEGAYFTHFDGSNQLLLVGLNDGAILYQHSVELQDVPQFVKVDWLGVDEIQMWGGGVLGDASIPSRWILDDFTLAPIAAEEDTALYIPGVAITDVESGSGVILLTLAVDHGSIFLSGSVAGGLSADAITGNGTGHLTLTGSIAAINATLAANGGVRYSADADYAGRDFLRLTMVDAGDASAAPLTDSKLLGIEIHPINDAPVANDESVRVLTNAPLTLHPLANDSDIDGDALTITQVSGPLHGSVTFTGTSITYTPATGFSGFDTLNYMVSDGMGGSDTATILLRVDQPNVAPQITSPARAGTEDVTMHLTAASFATDGNGDPLSFTSFSASSGTWVLNADGSVDYTPGANFAGTVPATVQISDGQGGVVSGVLSLSFAAVPDAPVAQTVAASVQEDSSVLISTAGFISDPDGQSVQITAVAQGQHGTVVYNGDGTFLYSPVANYEGADSFSYTIKDSGGATSTGTINVTVQPEVDLIIGGDGPDSLIGTEGGDLLAGLGGNDSLNGGAGNDFLMGNEGDDSLTGGQGADTFYLSVGGGTDTVNDFSHAAGDKLDISELLYNWNNGSGGALAQFLQISSSGGSTTVSIDVDGPTGPGGFVAVALLTGVTGVTTDDLILSGGN
jgi:large repetitive protein